MQFWDFHGGVHLAGHKHPACDAPVESAVIPPYLVLPLQQHAGIPATPKVAVGDAILKGQVIAHCVDTACAHPGSVPLHAPTSGRVKAIEEHPVPHPSGLSAPCIIIETDGRDAWGERPEVVENCTELSPDELRQRVAQAGIVGLGGAGFPSHIKLRSPDIHTLILNGAECEPYITCDDRLMQERPADIIIGSKILSHVLGRVEHCIIALEDNKPAAYKALRQCLADPDLQAQLDGFDVQVHAVPTIYPTGGERQLIKVLTGREVPHGSFPSQFGIVMHNVETAAKIYRAAKYSEPLISRIVTITGDAVAQPRNLEVLLGTPIHALLEQCGRGKTPPRRLIMGGPMMGFPLLSEDLPVIKTTNCIIATGAAAPAAEPPVMPCIRCGSCAQVCPINLLPQQMYWHARAKDLDKAEAYNIFDCIECGCCAYVCPSHIPLVQYYRYTKAELRKRGHERELAEQARQRHEFRTFRLEREKAERRARHEQKRSELKQSDKANDAEDKKKALIQAALERVKAKKQQKQTDSMEEHK